MLIHIYAAAGTYNACTYLHAHACMHAWVTYLLLDSLATLFAIEKLALVYDV